jgi:hypothetical protein
MVYTKMMIGMGESRTEEEKTYDIYIYDMRGKAHHIYDRNERPMNTLTTEGKKENICSHV